MAVRKLALLRLAAAVSIAGGLLALGAVWRGAGGGGANADTGRVEGSTGTSAKRAAPPPHHDPIVHRELADSGCLPHAEHVLAVLTSLEGLRPVLIDDRAVRCLARHKSGLPPLRPELVGSGKNLKRDKRKLFADGAPPVAQGCVQLGLMHDDFEHVRRFHRAYNGTLWAEMNSRLADDHLLLRPGGGAHILLTRIVHGNGTDYWLYPASELDQCAHAPRAVIVPRLCTQRLGGGDGAAAAASLLVPDNAELYAWQMARGTAHMECDSELAAKFKAVTWPNDLKEIYKDQNPKNFTLWVYSMVAIRDMMYALRVPAMLSQGTLLGWYRNCDFIPYTTDMDMAFLSDDYTAEIERAFRDHPHFPNPHVYGMPQDGFELSSWYKNYNSNDLFAIYHEGNRSWFGSTNNAEPADLPKHRWYAPAVGSLCTGALRGRLFLVPCNAVAMLAAWYGDDWRVPDKNHGRYDYHVHMGIWPNSTRRLVEREEMLVCWNGGTERPDGTGCQCTTGYTGRHCRFQVPLQSEKS